MKTFKSEHLKQGKIQHIGFFPTLRQAIDALSMRQQVNFNPEAQEHSKVIEFEHLSIVKDWDAYGDGDTVYNYYFTN